MALSGAVRNFIMAGIHHSKMWIMQTCKEAHWVIVINNNNYNLFSYHYFQACILEKCSICNMFWMCSMWLSDSHRIDYMEGVRKWWSVHCPWGVHLWTKSPHVRHSFLFPSVITTWSGWVIFHQRWSYSAVLCQCSFISAWVIGSFEKANGEKKHATCQPASLPFHIMGNRCHGLNLIIVAFDLIALNVHDWFHKQFMLHLLWILIIDLDCSILSPWGMIWLQQTI